MYRKTDLLNDIMKLKINPSGTVMIHASLKAIGEVEGGADTVLDAWMEYMKDGLLLFVTHTWEKIPYGGTTIYDVKTSPSCVGILGEIFRKRPNVIRSLHPTHSVAAFGKDAADYVSGEEHNGTPCSRGGCYGKLLDRKAQIVFIGCDLTKNTFIHGAEEWNNIPDRVSNEPTYLTIIDYDGNKLPYTRFGHKCSACDDVSGNYGKLEKPFAALSAIHYGSFGSAEVIVGDAEKMYEITSAFLKKNPNIFIDKDSIPTEWYS